MTKKHLYQILASVSLLGTVVGTTIVQPRIVFANDFSAQKGTFTVGGSAINVRSAPSTDAAVVEQYQPGQQVNYDQIGTSNGYRWISYIGSSGNRRYVAIGTADGATNYGQLTGGAPAPTPPTHTTAANGFSAQKGTFTVGGAAINVRSEPSTSAQVVEQYQPGQQVNYDQIGTSNGYRWISYVGSSGNRRYVAIGTADGATNYGQLTGGTSTPTAKASSALDPMRQSFSNGDFSALAGQWKNGKGEVITVTSDGKMTYASRPSDPHQLQRPSHYNEQEPEGEVHFGVRVNAMTGHYGGRYAPAGTAFAPGLGTGDVDDSDTSRERLIFGQGRQTSNKEDSYYRVEAATTSKPSSQPEKAKSTDQKDLIKDLTGTWKNAQGDVVTISADGKFTGKTVMGEKREVSISSTKSNFPNLSSFTFDNTGFYYDPKQDAILIYTHSDYQPTPGHEHFYTRVKTEESQSSSSDKDTTTTDSKSSSGTLATEKRVEAGNPIQKFYQQLTNRKDLPSTGEAVSVLVMAGAGLVALAMTLIKRKQKTTNPDKP